VDGWLDPERFFEARAKGFVFPMSAHAVAQPFVAAKDLLKNALLRFF